MNQKRSLFEIHLAVLLFGLAGLFGKWLDLSPVIIVLFPFHQAKPENLSTKKLFSPLFSRTYSFHTLDCLFQIHPSLNCSCRPAVLFHLPYLHGIPGASFFQRKNSKIKYCLWFYLFLWNLSHHSSI